MWAHRGVRYGIGQMKSLLWYALASVGEIAGCFAFWAWLRLGKTPLWALPGMISLVVFALALTRIDAALRAGPTLPMAESILFLRCSG